MHVSDATSTSRPCKCIVQDSSGVRWARAPCTRRVAHRSASSLPDCRPCMTLSPFSRRVCSSPTSLLSRSLSLRTLSMRLQQRLRHVTGGQPGQPQKGCPGPWHTATTKMQSLAARRPIACSGWPCSTATRMRTAGGRPEGGCRGGAPCRRHRRRLRSGRDRSQLLLHLRSGCSARRQLLLSLLQRSLRVPAPLCSSRPPFSHACLAT